MKKKQWLLGMVLAGMLALCGCGNSSDDTQMQTNDSDVVQTSVQPVSTENEKETAQNPEAEETPKPTPTPNPRAQYTVVIDAGHQKKANTKLEPIGPGADEKKPKVASGTQGVSTGIPEYKINLQVALKLQKELEAKGYQVVMIRTTHNVDISNKERAKIANKSGDIFIRLHCDSVTDSSVEGVLAVCPTANNPYRIGKLFGECEELSYAILSRVCDKTGAKNRGVLKTDYMSGINYCKIPVTIIEMGCMSNPAEDVRLSKKSYQKKIVKGISKGIDDYFGIKKKRKK